MMNMESNKGGLKDGTTCKKIGTALYNDWRKL
jgi:hypothetical protein